MTTEKTATTLRNPAWYGWIPAGGSLVYIFSTTMCRSLLRRYGPVRTVKLGACAAAAATARLAAAAMTRLPVTC